MTTQEFSDQFDILFNNITSNQAPGINEYEKSVFLTKAQNQLVTEYFNNRVDQVGGGFDGSQKRQYDFSSLIKTADLKPCTVDITQKLDRRSKSFLFPEDYFLSVNEMIWDSKYQYSVTAIDYAEYYRLMQKPFAYPPKKTIWRLITGKKTDIDFGIQGYSMGTKYKTPISITYISLPADTDTWYGSYAVEAPLGEYTYTLHGVTDTYTYPNIDGGTITPLPQGVIIEGGYIPFEYQSNCYWAKLSSRGIVLLGWSTGIKTDAQVADIITALLTAFKNSGSLYDALEDLEYLTTPEEQVYNFSVPYTEYSQFPGTGLTEEPVGLTLAYNSSTGSIVEIIGSLITKEEVSAITYRMRYIHKLSPIILTDLSSEYGTEVKIEGKQDPTECELPDETHQEILERAVTLAKIAWQGGTLTQAQQQRGRNDED